MRTAETLRDALVLRQATATMPAAWSGCSFTRAAPGKLPKRYPRNEEGHPEAA